MSLNIFLEFVPGGSIASLLAKFGSFTESVIRVYTKQILLGLEFLHTHQIMHRDIKGANILVDNSGVVKLADFGASKKIEDLVTVDSGCKSIKGTPYWMAPEVITQTGHGRQADIWSVGCTVIEMATGKPPWSQHFPVPMSAMFHIASSKHPPPLPERLSPEARDFLMLCFNRVPKERPNATRLLQHPFLSAALSSSGGAPSKLPTTAPQPTTALRPVTPPPDVTPPGPPPVPGSGFRYIPPNKPLSPVAEVNSAGLGSLGPSPLGRKPSEAAGRPGLPPVRKTSGRQGGLPEDAVAGPVFKSSMSVTDPLNESLALTVDSMMSSISYNPVEEPSWMQSMASSSSFALPPPQPIYFGKENAWPSPSGANIAGEKALAPLEPSEEPDQLPGDEEKIMEYVREKAFRETTRLSTPFLEHKVSGSSPAQQSMPGNSPPQVLNLEGPSPTALPPRPRVGRPVRPKTDNERMSKSRQWEAELERELEEERMKSKTPRSQRTPRDNHSMR
uniref:Protein kinase domain-containing protein n=1 Tax=Tetraselmis chuii TaxID=63592 RepID=A0A7S1X2H0_9CHLO